MLEVGKQCFGCTWSSSTAASANSCSTGTGTATIAQCHAYAVETPTRFFVMVVVFHQNLQDDNMQLLKYGTSNCDGFFIASSAGGALGISWQLLKRTFT